MEKGSSTEGPRRDLYELIRYLFRKVRKITAAIRAIDKRFWNLERKCGECHLAETMDEMKRRVVDVERKCCECQERRKEWRVDVRTLIVGIAIAIISGIAVWFLTRGS